MKLLFCPECQDVRKLGKLRHLSCVCDECIRKYRTICECGESWGVYTGIINATIGGKAIPLGFDNASLRQALEHRPESGMGERFEAFVIPEYTDSIYEDKE